MADLPLLRDNPDKPQKSYKHFFMVKIDLVSVLEKIMQSFANAKARIIGQGMML